MAKDTAVQHIEAAVAAGLRYVGDSMPGIRRERTDGEFRYVDPKGDVINDSGELQRIKSLVIPPAWTDVWICPEASGHIQVTARDAKGRKQYRYHPRYREIRDETKFGRMLEFSDLLPAIRYRVERDVSRPGLPREKVLATVVRLLEKTLIRVGNDEYARDNQSFGLTTLRRRHVRVSGSKMRFEFRGKSGVVRSVAITDLRLARIVQRCQTLPGQELFKFLDDNGKRQTIDSGDINDYLREITGEDVTAKDFRTWAGTMLAAAALRDLGPGEDSREVKSNVVTAVDRVAERLGNTRATCRKYYIHPALIQAYERGLVPEAPPAAAGKRRARPSAEIRREEAAVLQFLQTHATPAGGGTGSSDTPTHEPAAPDTDP